MLHRTNQLESQRKSSVGVWGRFNRLSGWRTSAFVNTVLVGIVFLVLLTSHIILWAKQGNPAGYHVIHEGRCAGEGVGRLNTVLHLIINVLSSLVLASTNFFMQVLNAPSREELDSAHEKGSWLDIGVPSPRNTFKVSRFKMIMWLLFFLSSIPIHLLFNSAIFSTDHRGSEFSYFAFDESVLTGGEAFDPGTKLAVPYDLSIKSNYYNYSTGTWANSTTLDAGRKLYFETDHQNRSQSIQNTTEEIRKGGWQKLDRDECSSLYNTTHCAGLRTYRNVALILRGSSGWNRSQVWDLSANESSFWDEYVPKDVNNALWYADISNYSDVGCTLSTATFQDGSGTEVYCDNSCDKEMGFDSINSDTWSFPLFSYSPLYSFSSTGLNATLPQPEFRNANLSVEYCLAEPLETVCQIGLASTLLWVVSVCVLVKMVLCIVVLVKLGKDRSLVTPGDVIESFISHPPDYSLGSCLLDRTSLRSYTDNGHLLVNGPIQWISKTHRRWDAIPKRIWVSSYLIFAFGIALLIYFFGISYYTTHWKGSFGQDVGNETIGFPYGFSPNFEQAILIANSPQLFLSLAYLAFNGLFTRLHMAKEWAAMSTWYKALRVTNPQGQQSSTYFLQLPYRYSVPLLVISILLHWVLSGCIYLLVMQGDYFSSSGSEGPFDSVMAVGFSTKSLLTMMILSITLAFTPPFFGRLSLPSSTVVVGSNSLAIAAACQVSPLVGQNEPQTRQSHQEFTAGHQDDDIELRRLMAPSPGLSTPGDKASETWNDEEERKATLLRVSQSKIRWGVVKMPSSWGEQFIRRDTEVGHISFGLPEDDVQEPIVGHWYA